MQKQTIKEVLEINPIDQKFWSNIKGNVIDFSTGNPNPNISFIWGNHQTEWDATLLIPVAELGNSLHKKTFRSTTNLIIIPESLGFLFKSLSNYRFLDFAAHQILIDGAKYFGTLNSTIHIHSVEDNYFEKEYNKNKNPQFEYESENIPTLKNKILVCYFNEDGIWYKPKMHVNAVGTKTLEFETHKDINLINKIQEYGILNILHL